MNKVIFDKLAKSKFRSRFKLKVSGLLSTNTGSALRYSPTSTDATNEYTRPKYLKSGSKLWEVKKKKLAALTCDI